MYRSISLIIVATLCYVALLPAFAADVYKWVDEKGVTHYSDMAPASLATQMTLIEIPAIYSTTSDAEKDYYSITNQWMRLHQERIEREKIKIEKAKQKAAQQQLAPQVVYLNEPYEDRYVVGYPYYFYNKHRRHRSHDNSNRRFRDKSNKHYGDKHTKHQRRGRSDKIQGQERGRGSRTHRKASGLKLEIH